MDGKLAIKNNLQALKRILAGLVGMAGLRRQFAPEAQSWRAGGTTTGGEGRDAAEGSGDPAGTRPVDSPNTLPRHLRLAILRLLRPAESAARRLIVAAARGLVVTLPPPRAGKPKPAPADPILRRFGIAVTLSPAAILPRSRGTILSPELVEGSKGGGGGGVSSLPLFDPPRRFRRNGRTVPAHAAPRIGLPGVTERRPLPAPPAPDDPIDATRLNLRLAALAAALDDVAGQARRFARLQARRRQALILPCEAGEVSRRDGGGVGDVQRAPVRRISPLRPGRPPGGRLARYDPSQLHPRGVREIDEILAHAHALALHALRPPDSS